MKKIQPHFQKMLKKLNIILKKQSHMKIMTANSFRYLIKRILVIVFTFGGLRALYASITGRYSICLTKKIFQLYTVIIGRNLSCRSNFWEILTILIHKHSTISESFKSLDLLYWYMFKH